MKLKQFLDTHNHLFESGDIPEKNKNGKCYQVSMEYMMKNSKDKNLRLCHGLVTGQGALDGIIYNHAWCEKGDEIIDLTLPKKVQKLPKALYYAIGHIKTVFCYDYKEMAEKVQEFETYGPWEPVLLKNKY